MLPNNLTPGLSPAYNRDPIQKNSMYWWLGQVVDEEHWIGNEKLENHKRDDLPGWGKRYRVRIFSRDSHIKDATTSTPDNLLRMAEVIAPVTAGSGHGGYGETVSLEQGSFVMGFYLDGEQGDHPVIIGCLPNNPQTRLFGGDPADGFVPRSGFYGNTGNKRIATKDLHTEPSSQPARESTTTDGAVNDARREYQKQDGSDAGVRKKNIECEGGGGPVKGIQGFIQRALAMIKRIKEETQSFLGAASDITSNISSIVNSTSSFIASMMKLIIGKMRGYVINKINAGIKDVADKLPPNVRQTLAGTAEKATDTLGCIFQRIISNLFKLVKGLFNDLIEKYISAPMCAAEKLVGDVVGSVLGDITSGINSALGSINGLISSVGDIAGQAFEVLDIVTGILNFLKCDTTPNCDYKDRWSFWNGDKEAASVSEGLGNLLKDASNNIPGSIPPCNTDQLPCGPPSISFSGGGGTGLAANPIVSLSGQIMGFDFSSFGSGYTSTPTLSIDDQCGNGGGSNVFLTSNETDDGVEITGAVVKEPGSGYLPTTSKDQTTISEPGDTIYKDPDGKWQVYKPGSTIEIPSVDDDPNSQFPNIAAPSGTEIAITDTDTGEVVDTVIGRGPLTPIRVPTGVTITAPQPLDGDGDDGRDDDRPIGDGQSEDIILDGVFIDDSGANYDIGDQIVITPSNGAEMSPIFDDIGRLVDVVITNPGNTFNEYPRIFIKSELGVNANIIPMFRVRRSDEDPDERLRKIQGDRIITVDDCIARPISGYINGKPYYGEYHYFRGKKVVGPKKPNLKNRIYLSDTPEESLRKRTK